MALAPPNSTAPRAALAIADPLTALAALLAAPPFAWDSRSSRGTVGGSSRPTSWEVILYRKWSGLRQSGFGSNCPTPGSSTPVALL
jgi:hypothetical protein